MDLKEITSFVCPGLSRNGTTHGHYDGLYICIYMFFLPPEDVDHSVLTANVVQESYPRVSLSNCTECLFPCVFLFARRLRFICFQMRNVSARQSQRFSVGRCRLLTSWISGRLLPVFVWVGTWMEPRTISTVGDIYTHIYSSFP